ncbi:MAG: phosphoglucosamine mutase [Gammaproteobacteria bacterium]|nr:phosphoglucosamine mutase [Gammaproteobacteria bacterium]
MKNGRKYFGTDGIRGRVGEAPITAEFCLRLGWAVGKVFAAEGSPLVLIGKDTRISGYMIESVLEAGLVSAGADVRLLTPIPTPAVAYLTRTFRAGAGIVISASHNAYEDNGIKFFDSRGHKLPDEVELAIEERIGQPMKTVRSSELGKVVLLDDARGRYIEFCKSTVSRQFRLRGMKIVLDCANGATYAVAPSVFSELGAEVVLLAAEPDGMNINEACGSTHPEAMAKMVVESGADVGIAFDGDGDRVVMADHNGDLVDGDELLYVIAQHAACNGQLRGGVVGTLMSNLGLERALSKVGIPFTRTDVGDRFVIEAMRRLDWGLGGESSGHIVCSRLTTTGDGIIAALQVLVAMVENDQSLKELASGMVRLPQSVINVGCADPEATTECTNVSAAVDDVEDKLAGRGRVLLRPSGTEPVVRVMVEGDDAGEVAGHAQALAQVVRSASV